MVEFGMVEKRKRITMGESAEQVFAYLLGYYVEHSYMPTLVEIAQHMGRKRDRVYSVSWVRLILARLESFDRIRVDKYQLRGISIVEK